MRSVSAVTGATRWRALALVLAVGAGACASVPEGAEGVPGCYSFVRDAAVEDLRLPWGVVLEAEPLAGGPEGAYEAETATSATERVALPFGYWRLAEGDSVQIGHPRGGGYTLVMARTADGLSGRATPTGDALELGEEPGERASTPVSALRVACPG